MFGVIIQQLIGIVSICSSIAFVVMTYRDWSDTDACCMPKEESGEYLCPVGCDPVLDCLLNCDAFYNSRMPKSYELIDIFICLVYLVQYILMIFISHSRYAFFISNQSIQEMFIIAPVLIFPYECSRFGLFMKALSRMLRIYKIEIFLRTQDVGADSNVSK